jgi:hypothetical protein
MLNKKQKKCVILLKARRSWNRDNFEAEVEIICQLDLDENEFGKVYY